MSEFIEVDVEHQGVSMRWKLAAPVSELQEVEYESEEGVAGKWRVFAIDEHDTRAVAHCAHVEDSSDGVVLLVFGGRAGLLLEHDSGAHERQPYLLLARTTHVG